MKPNTLELARSYEPRKQSLRKAGVTLLLAIVLLGCSFAYTVAEPKTVLTGPEPPERGGPLIGASRTQQISTITLTAGYPASAYVERWVYAPASSIEEQLARGPAQIKISQLYSAGVLTNAAVSLLMAIPLYYLLALLFTPLLWLARQPLRAVRFAATRLRRRFARKWEVA